MKKAAIGIMFTLFLFAIGFLFWWGLWHWFQWNGIFAGIAWTIGMIIFFFIKSKTNRNEDIQDHL